MSLAITTPALLRNVAPVDAIDQREKGAWRALSAHVYLPACAILAVAVALVGMGWASHWGGAEFVGSLTSLRVVVVGPVSLVIIGIFLVVERMRPAQLRPRLARGYRQDLLYAVFNATIVLPLVTTLTLSFSAVLTRLLPWIVIPRIGIVPRWVAIVAIFVVMDGCNWFVHLANHRVQMLWRFHELHHSQEDMNVLTVFRTHPLIHVSYLFALIPGVVLLANGALSTTLLAGYACIVAFAHSNTNLGFGYLGRIFVSPNYHRIHHRLEGPQDVNLGFALTIWDQIFHRAVFPTPETIRIDTGLRGRPLIVEQSGERPRLLFVFAVQLIAPFRPMNGRSDLPSIRPGTGRRHEESDWSAKDRDSLLVLAVRDNEESEVA